jgi:hypothetical protein
VLVTAPTVRGLALVALLLGALVPGTVADLLLQGPKYPLASGLGIVAMIKPTTTGETSVQLNRNLTNMC